MTGETAARDRMRAVLRGNVGFDDPERWLDKALAGGFTRVEAIPRPVCPDCGGAAAEQLGQYVYYSTLMRLRGCGQCGLFWSDALLPAEIVRRHFEVTYKDRAYFVKQRRLVFDDLVRRVSRRQPGKGTVLDIGGAQGDLMAAVQRARPDLQVCVHDLSAAATEYAARHFGVETLHGDIASLAQLDRQFDVVVLSDVLYYEPCITAAWDAIGRLVAPGGAVLLRLPNRLPLIRLAALARRLRPRGTPAALQDDIAFYNPEHLYVLSRRYLARRLSALGFRQVRFETSPPMLPEGGAVRQAPFRAVELIARRVCALTGGALLLSPTMIVEGVRAASSAPRQSSPT
jgi:SAM-dependent methyltransferase